MAQRVRVPNRPRREQLLRKMVMMSRRKRTQSKRTRGARPPPSAKPLAGVQMPRFDVTPDSSLCPHWAARSLLRSAGSARRWAAPEAQDPTPSWAPYALEHTSVHDPPCRTGQFSGTQARPVAPSQRVHGARTRPHAYRRRMRVARQAQISHRVPNPSHQRCRIARSRRRALACQRGRLAPFLARDRARRRDTRLSGRRESSRSLRQKMT